MALFFVSTALVQIVFAAPLSNVGCLKSGYDEAWRGLIQKTAVMANDTRYGLSEGQRAFDLDKDVIETNAAAVGIVSCSGRTFGNGGFGTGFVVGTNDTIVTNSHLFYDDDGRAVEPLTECYFEIGSKPPLRRALNLESAVFGSRNPEKEPNLDYAIIKLDKPLTNIKPIKLKRSTNVEEGDELYVLSAIQQRMRRSVRAGESVIQKCQARKVYSANEVRGPVALTDCSSTIGASGSPNFKREPDGSLTFVGIHTGGGAETKDGTPFDLKERNFGKTLIASGKFLSDLERALSISNR